MRACLILTIISQIILLASATEAGERFASGAESTKTYNSLIHQK